MYTKKLWTLILIFIPFLAKTADPVSTPDERKKIEWLPVLETSNPDESPVRTLRFQGGSYNEDFLPEYVQTVKLNSNSSSIQATLSSVETDILRESNLILHPEKIGTEFKIETSVVYRKKVPFASVRILPIRKNKNGPGYERLLSFQLDVTPSSISNRNSPARYYSTNSVLANGDWYKLSLTKNGVHKLTYNDLKNLGVDVDNIDPTSLRIYGNGGGMLPQANAKSRPDDLKENAIVVIGESDGHFDPTDYVLFYGTSQVRWLRDAGTNHFTHLINQYSDSTFYFLTTSLGPGKRIQQRASSSASPNQTVTSFDDYAYHEIDAVNLLKSGREWYGENFDNVNNTHSFTFNFPGTITTDTLLFKASVIGRAENSSSNSFSITLNGQTIITQAFSSVGSSPQDNYAAPLYLSKTLFPNSSSINVSVSMSTADPNGQGWLNAIDLNARCQLNMLGQGDQFHFRDTRSAGIGNISEFQLNNTPSTVLVWDVTDPINVVLQAANFNSSTTSFITETNSLHEFIAFNETGAYSPVLIGQIENQNLHASPKSSLLIVTNPLFIDQANELADFHRTHDNYSTVVATTDQIFNEFSSGAQDVSAIRDFVKMFYDRAFSPADLPRYLLILGDASYDNKSRVSSNTNFVTSYQSAGSLNQTQTYMSDDFFGLLDDAEGDWSNGEIVDMSVGRLPVKTVQEAEGMVRKILHYAGADLNGTLSSNGINSTVYADWRNIVTFIADDQDSNTHFKQADTLARRVSRDYPLLNIDKVYVDAYNQQSTPGGNRYPDGHKALIDRVQKGALLLTYIGHGGEVGWGHERFLEVDDINNWSNLNAMPAFLTATCEFTRVDDPGRTSAGELVFLNPNGGGICLFTTSRLAFSSSNYNLCQRFFTHVFSQIDGHMPTIGDIFEQTKIDVYTDQYVRNFLLIGDPALKMAYPQLSVRTNTINGNDITTVIDTLKALKKITITGEVLDVTGAKASTFNGIIYPTVFDKWVTYSTLGNDRNVITDPSYPAPFELQKNIIYRGKASVVNGDFSFSFVVPKDIQFQYGSGKLSYYAQNGSIDAAGYSNRLIVGGYDTSVPSDAKGPEIKLYINDEKFVRGGMTDKNPVLYAVVVDSSGLNTVGTGIGHDMTAELDNSSNKIYVLNDYYENDLNSYQQGKVKYPFKDLSAGPHSVNLKVWDVYNNSSEATTEFVVAESAKLALEHVLNYPNPFTTHTTFMFEHNRPFTNLDIQVQIYTVSGKLIKTIASKIFSEGYRSDELEWNGLDDFGDRIGKGVYVYKLRVRTSDGDYADKFEKLVILR
ncbi:MAG: type IX secretion system sortase PorU [Bacteroidia bacterium]|nr:type IX secretion system sortase PorU [Bacteroidia bacterium]MBP6648525.1 type IX secretion system sortase PorU [Bacteroidia bacterium]